MPSSFVTPLLLPFGEGEGSYAAAVISADATAIAYAVHCPLECGVNNLTVTVGPWADKTLAPGAAETGEYDVRMSATLDDTPVTMSFHCDVSRTVAYRCTSTDISNSNHDTIIETLTYSKRLSQWGFDTMEWSPVTITAGQELLANTHAGSIKASATGDAPDNTQAASNGATATGSSATPTTIQDSEAASSIFSVFTTLLVAGITISSMML